MLRPRWRWNMVPPSASSPFRAARSASPFQIPVASAPSPQPSTMTSAAPSPPVPTPSSPVPVPSPSSPVTVPVPTPPLSPTASVTVTSPLEEKTEEMEEDEIVEGACGGHLFQVEEGQCLGAEGGVSNEVKCKVTQVHGNFHIKERNITVLRPTFGKSKEIVRHPRDALVHRTNYLVRLVEIQDPSNFRMELILDPPKSGNGVFAGYPGATWEGVLDRFYRDPRNSRKYRLKTLAPLESQLYAIYSHELQKWERVRVLRLNLEKQTVTAQAMDRLLEFDSLPISGLRELHPKFGNWHKYPLNGRLRDVEPRNWHELLKSNDASASSSPGKPENPGTWSPESIQFFKSLVQDKIMNAYIVSIKLDRDDKFRHWGRDSRFTKVSILLFPGPEGTEIARPDEINKSIPVNALLVQQGFASPSGDLERCIEIMEKAHGLTTDPRIVSKVKAENQARAKLKQEQEERARLERPPWFVKIKNEKARTN